MLSEKSKKSKKRTGGKHHFTPVTRTRESDLVADPSAPMLHLYVILVFLLRAPRFSGCCNGLLSRSRDRRILQRFKNPAKYA
eukprot:6179454-Pleurochrysis_carterae.AAC.1